MYNWCANEKWKEEKVNVEHYVQKLKEHESNRTSTNERNNFWKNYDENK